MRLTNPIPVFAALSGAVAAAVVLALIYETIVVPAAERKAASAAETAIRLEVQTATNEELARQRESVRAALANLEQALSEAIQQRDALLARLETEILDYEIQREAEGRTCGLSDADVDWLLRH